MIRRVVPACLLLMCGGLVLAQTPASQPATVKLEDLLDKLPADLKPVVGETTEQKAARDAWFKTQAGDSLIRVTMDVTGTALDIEPREVIGMIGAQITVGGKIEMDFKTGPVQQGDQLTMEGVHPKITIVPSGRTTVSISSVRIVSVTPKK